MDKLEQKIKEFSEAVRETKEFKDYKQTNDAYQADSEAKTLLQNFQEAQQNLIILQQGGFSGVEEQKEKTEKLLNEVRKNKVINEWAQSQKKMQELTGDLATFLSDDTGFLFAPPQKGCGCG